MAFYFLDTTVTRSFQAGVGRQAAGSGVGVVGGEGGGEGGGVGREGGGPQRASLLTLTMARRAPVGCAAIKLGTPAAAWMPMPWALAAVARANLQLREGYKRRREHRRSGARRPIDCRRERRCNMSSSRDPFSVNYSLKHCTFSDPDSATTRKRRGLSGQPCATPERMGNHSL